MTADADLLVVGAGAKAAAVAAKVHAINRLGLGSVTLRIVEAVEPAASWSGISGMTSGDETLAITPHKDIGFPYESHRMFGERGAAIDAVLAELSWQGYMIATGGYARWLNADSPPITHREYGRYVAWVLSRATDGVRLTRGRAVRVALDDDRWIVTVTDGGDLREHRAAAVMLTGPGVHRPLAHDPAAAARIVHCDDSRDDFARIPVDRPSDVAIVGGGEGAISCMVFLRHFRPAARLTIHTPEPPLSRGESFLENRVFSDPDCIGWSALDEQYRRSFIHHTDRGVFGPEALSRVAHDDHCSFVAGRVTHVAAGPERLHVAHDSVTGPTTTDYDFVANCTGFDLLSQVRELLAPEARDEIEARIGPVWRSETTDVPFGRMLELEGLHPRLHVPGLAGLSQGPGFANLGCLGLLANRVVQAFVLDETAPSRERTVA